jgi:nickel-dependent lactate racemase
MVEIWLPYGSSEVAVRVPEETLIDILKPQADMEKPDVAIEIKRLVSSNPEFQNKVKNARHVCVALGSSRNARLLRESVNALLAELGTIGVQPDRITVLLTPDSALPETELESGLSIIRHSSNSQTGPISSLQSEFTPEINSLLMDAPIRIAVGELCPNSVLGFSGLPDLIFPGLGSEASIQREVSGRKPLTPSEIHKERLEIALQLSDLFALGFVLNEDRSLRHITIDTFGKCLNHLEEIIRGYCTRTVEKAADIVIMSAGGTPTDETLLRSLENFPNGLSILKRNGALIVASECASGSGNGEFYAWSAEKKEARYLESRLRHSFNFNGWKAAYLARAIQNHRIYLVSTIPDHHVENVFGLRPAKTVNAALLSAQRALGNDSKISVIPDPTSVIVSLKLPEKPPGAN